MDLLSTSVFFSPMCLIETKWTWHGFTGIRECFIRGAKFGALTVTIQLNPFGDSCEAPLFSLTPRCKVVVAAKVSAPHNNKAIREKIWVMNLFWGIQILEKLSWGLRKNWLPELIGLRWQWTPFCWQTCPATLKAGNSAIHVSSNA